MKHLRLFETEADYTAATLDLPVISYVKKTGNVYYNGKHAVDRVLNAPLMNMCVANGWAKESNDYLTYDEAAIISTINTSDFATYEVVSAWELKYFTGLTSITFATVVVPTLKELYIPDTYTGYYAAAVIINNKNACWCPNIIRLHVGDNAQIKNCYAYPLASREGFNNSIVYIGENAKWVGSGTYPLFSMFKTAIIMGEGVSSRGSADMATADVQQITFFVEDDQVEAFQALTPFKRSPSNVHALSEYIGDTDY